MQKELDVYLYQQKAGKLLQDKTGHLSFSYEKDWLHNNDAIALSNSLPLGTKTFDHDECRPFFAGILPEEDKRRVIAHNLGISPKNDFALLTQLGGECAGAVTLLPKGEPLAQQADRYRIISDTELANVLRELPRKPLMAGEAGIRLSLAGAQDKLAVKLQNGVIALPLETAPSTHIIKPAVDHLADLVQNETVCQQLALAVGLPAAKTSIKKAADIEYLISERYDRFVKQDGSIERIHQEDFCQALGIAPEMKYQNEGGPSLRQCFNLLRTISSTPVLDLQILLEAVIFNFLIGNHDAHGKNFSLLYHNNQTRLAPLYDLVCTVYYPELTTKMAMKIGSKYRSKQVMLRHFEQLAQEAGFTASIVRYKIIELTDKLIAAIENTVKPNAMTHDLLALIYKRCIGIRKRFDPNFLLAE
ncbi:MAG: type II toxin-antitoxin system HipA family toxin [Gammaproteobacteria bacterium]|nr:type II toxin-antitoxin system HipA family toxin [Gammaproteobacteria bacterium]